MQAFLKFRRSSAVYAVLDDVRTPPARKCSNSRKKSLYGLVDRFSVMTRSGGVVSLIVLLVGTILVADHVAVAFHHAPTVARSSPQLTATSMVVTSTLAGHDKSGNEVRAFSTQPAGAKWTPWRPPVVNLNYAGVIGPAQGAVMSKPIRVHLIWYVDRSLLHRLHCDLYVSVLY